MTDRLDRRALNRATLDRQLLLRRSARTPRQAIAHLAGLQAQAPLAPYVGLWTRLAGFGPQHLKDLLTERTAVRAHLMRNTVHLVTAEDFVRFRPLYQPLMARGLAGNFGPRLAGVDLAELTGAAAAPLSQRPLTRGQLGAQLAPRWPGHASAPGCARSPAPKAARSWTCRTRPAPAPTSRRRPASCPSTTTCCSPSPNAAGSSRTPVRSRCRRVTAAPGARCSSTGSGRPTGRSPKASCTSSRSPG